MNIYYIIKSLTNNKYYTGNRYNCFDSNIEKCYHFDNLEEIKYYFINNENHMDAKNIKDLYEIKIIIDAR